MYGDRSGRGPLLLAVASAAARLVGSRSSPIDADTDSGSDSNGRGGDSSYSSSSSGGDDGGVDGEHIGPQQRRPISAGAETEHASVEGESTPPQTHLCGVIGASTRKPCRNAVSAVGQRCRRHTAEQSEATVTIADEARYEAATAASTPPATMATMTAAVAGTQRDSQGRSPPPQTAARRPGRRGRGKGSPA